MGRRLHSVPRTWSTAPRLLQLQGKLGEWVDEQPATKTIKPALSQRVSGPPCRAPAVTALLPKRKTEQRLGAHKCSVGRRTVGGCREGERGSAAPSRGAAVMAPCVAEAAGLQHPQRLQHRASPLAAHSRWLFPH
ncbi:hypothetical protein M440DRAFT_1464769 [Trichoderma longibrachiatum ATCC 18648]|uniref:Uncharacterized protein n=1 Tax=Trichoderma longibrachiatum ATCC 18648 TaxID=983965 RepID=A0A2T4BXJ4_TRILO|nr:hypothetical protein M440DRAFT_1464769 [Trichoderma longibrachiatum ATCC 18648]